MDHSACCLIGRGNVKHESKRHKKGILYLTLRVVPSHGVYEKYANNVVFCKVKVKVIPL
jgi:hypothetical protein